MYHRIVAGRVRAIFAQISAGDWEPMLSGLAAEFSYRFYGAHALSGERHTLEAMRGWWQRCFRLFPGAEFQVDEVIVTGWPWDTRIATRARIHAVLADGSSYDNVFMQNLSMRWARITEIHTLEDTAVLEEILDRLAAAGIDEAHAAPITDAAPVAAAGS
ncbi:MAG TPA: nuclear transport factor 2 family protein [Acidimicrobiales bacterium]|nr:nuclear transport factor 2 family protein [Acidimicrobiales bacterium]